MSNLIVCVTFDIVEDENLAIPVREARNGFFKIDPVDLSIDPGCHENIHIFDQFSTLGSFSSSHQLTRTVERYPCQPGSQARFPAKLRQVLDDADPCYLNHIFSVTIYSPNETNDQLIERGCVTSVQLTECFFLSTVQKGCDKFLINDSAVSADFHPHHPG
jgi:hypothetical protein